MSCYRKKVIEMRVFSTKDIEKHSNFASCINHIVILTKFESNIFAFLIYVTLTSLVKLTSCEFERTESPEILHLNLKMHIPMIHYNKVHTKFERCFQIGNYVFSQKCMGNMPLFYRKEFRIFRKGYGRERY